MVCMFVVNSKDENEFFKSFIKLMNCICFMLIVLDILS